MKTLRCSCPCDALRCADPSGFCSATEQEQVSLVAELGCVAFALGGKYSMRRAAVLATALRLLPGMSKLTERGIDQLVAHAADHSERGGEWLCETTHRIRSPALKRVAFRLASLLCAGDGGLDEPRQEFLLVLASGFGFTDEQAALLLSEATGWPVAAEREYDPGPSPASDRA
jgi:hypothetical protein